MGERSKNNSYAATCRRIGMGNFERGRAVIEVLGYGVNAARMSHIGIGQVRRQCDDPDLAVGTASKKRCAALFKLASLCLLEIQMEANNGRNEKQ